MDAEHSQKELASLACAALMGGHPQVIAVSAAALSRIVYPSVPQHTRVSLALVPFQPLAVTIANGVGIQVSRCRQTCIDVQDVGVHPHLCISDAAPGHHFLESIFASQCKANDRQKAIGEAAA